MPDGGVTLCMLLGVLSGQGACYLPILVNLHLPCSEVPSWRLAPFWRTC